MMLDLTNSSSEIVILNPKEVIGVLDLRSLGYYKIQQGGLQQTLSKFYNFKSAENVCNQFNNLINTLQKEETIETGGKIHLSNSSLHKEKKEVMDMLYKYKEAFSLTDNIGTCPNIEVEIDVTDKSPFY